MRAIRWVVCVATAVIGACAGEPDVEVASYSQSLDSCPDNQCGDGNSPVIDGVYFWKLYIASVPGIPNFEGVTITDVDHPAEDQPMRLELDGDRLLGVDRNSGDVLRKDYDLIGTRIRVEVLGVPWEIRITAAAPIEKFWVGGELPIWAYEFRYNPWGSPWGPHDPGKPLCSEADGDPNKLTAIVFGHELYNPDTKVITVGDTTAGWMNVACTSSAIYKMHKTGYTSVAGARLGISTSVAQRRAMLNAWTSKVCGRGRAFTKSDEPLKLRESLGLLPPDSAYLDPLDTAKTASIEAIWGETGAVCLTVHRREDNEATIRDEIDGKCGVLPPCDEWLGDWKLHGYVLTGNPRQ